MKLKNYFRNLNKFQNKADLGFTLLETLISLSIVSMMLLCIFMGVAVSVKAYSKSGSKLKESRELLLIDTRLRSSVERVKIPFYADKLNFAFTEHSISFSWVDGIDEMHSFEFNDIQIEKIELIQKNGKRPSGVRIKYLYDNTEYSVSCAFSTFPYGAIEI